MRHRKRRGKLGMKGAHRDAVMRNLVSSLIEHRRIKTTLPKAKQASRLADKLVTLGKTGTLHARRQAFSLLHNKDAVAVLFHEIAPEFKERNGGYTRVLHLDKRQLGNNASLGLLEFVGLAVADAKDAPEMDTEDADDAVAVDQAEETVEEAEEEKIEA